MTASRPAAPPRSAPQRTAAHRPVEDFPYEIKGGARARRATGPPARDLRPSRGRPARGAQTTAPVSRRKIDDGEGGRVGRSAHVRSSPPRRRSFNGRRVRPRASSGRRSAMATPPLTGHDDRQDSAASEGRPSEWSAMAINAEFYSTTAQVIPAVILALVIERRFLEPKVDQSPPASLTWVTFVMGPDPRRPQRWWNSGTWQPLAGCLIVVAIGLAGFHLVVAASTARAGSARSHR